MIKRAYTALAWWYLLAWCALPVLASALPSGPAGLSPGDTVVDGRVQSCVGDWGCPSDGPGFPATFVLSGVLLAPSAVLAVPLCAYLADRWQRPSLAGLVAAVVSWMALCGCGWFVLVAIE